MKRVLAIAVLLAGLALPSFVEAQRRSAPRSVPSGPVRMGPSFSGIRPAPRPVSMGRVRTAPVRTGIVMPSLSGRWRHGGSGGPFFRPRFFPRRRFFVQPLFVPSFWYSPFYSPWSQPTDSQPVEEAPAPPPEQNDALANQVERLADEVEMLREERASRAESRPPAATPQSAVDEKPVPAVLVYRDGRQGEAQNYAILGQTLWVFGEQGTRRIALAELDLEATKRLNDERGVEFVSPHSP